MNIKGVCYDVGREMFGNWRPDYNPATVHRELHIIKNELNCNSVRICGRDIGRLVKSSRDALEQGLSVWFSPELWNTSPEKTLRYVVSAASSAEKLRAEYPGQLVFSVGSELTLFMQGILPGRTFTGRLSNPVVWEMIKAGKHNPLLNGFLAKANTEVRRVFHGKVTYASIPAETVDWGLFDFVCSDLYRNSQIKDRYPEMVQRYFSFNKPVVVTEFGYCAYKGAEDAGGRAWGIVDVRSQILHRIPLLGKLVKPRLKGNFIRDEALQARELIDQLEILDRLGVEGAFIMTFVSPTSPTDDKPLYDLDMSSYSLVKSFAGGRHGTSFPDMTWEPKKAFRAVANYYSKH